MAEKTRGNLSVLPTELWELILHFAATNEELFDLETDSSLLESPYQLIPRPLHGSSECRRSNTHKLDLLRVCKVWHATLEGRLFDVVVIRSILHFGEVIAALHRPQSGAVSKDRRQSIRRLYLRLFPDISSDASSSTCPPFLKREIVDFISGCSNLEILEDRVKWTGSGQGHGAPDYSLAQAALKACTRLRCFNWNDVSHYRARNLLSDPGSDLVCFSALECLTSCVFGSRIMTLDVEFVPRATAFPALRALALAIDQSSGWILQWLTNCSLPTLAVVECIDKEDWEGTSHDLERFLSIHGHKVTSLKLPLHHPPTNALSHCNSTLTEMAIKYLHISLIGSLSFPKLGRIGVFLSESEPETGMDAISHAGLGLIEANRFPVLRVIRFLGISGSTLRSAANNHSLGPFNSWLQKCRKREISVEGQNGDCVFE